jgi:hypothetical protein
VGPPEIAVGCLVSVLALVRLGSQPLRLDEARTALVADAVLETGLPRVRSERPSLFPPSEIDENGLCVLHTPVQFYLAALARRFGKSPGATRLPFALVGVAAAWAAIALGDRVVPGSGVFVGLVFLQVPTLLLLRQARYYPLVIGGRVLVLWALVTHTWWLAIFAGILIAATEWSGYLATLAGSFVAASLGSWPMEEAALLSSGLVVIAVWAWVRRHLDQPVPMHRHLVDGFLESFWTYLWKLQCHLVPLLPLVAIAAAARARVPTHFIAGMTWIVLAHVALRSVTPSVFTRYLAAAIVPAGLAGGVLLYGISERSLPLAVALSVLLACTNVLHMGPLLLVPPRLLRALGFVRCPGGSYLSREAPEDVDRRIRLLLAEFLRELVRPPRLRVDGLAAALPAGSVVVAGQTEAATLQVAAPHAVVVPWGARKDEERAWLAEHPPDYVVLGDIDRPEDAVRAVPRGYQRLVLPARDVLLANGETLERHVFDDARLPLGVEALAT